MSEISEDDKLELQAAFENWLQACGRILGAANISFFEGSVSPRVYFKEKSNEFVVQSLGKGGVLIQCVLDFKTAVKLHGMIDMVLITMSRPREENQP